MFSQYSWEYETYFPTKVLIANTADENIDEENNRVTWSFSLPSLIKEPKVMKATIMNPKSASGNPIRLYGIIAVVVIAILVFAFHKKDLPALQRSINHAYDLLLDLQPCHS